MTRYELRVSASAERSLARIPEFAAAAVIEFMTGSLTEDPGRVGKRLHLDLVEFHAARRGAYRIVYLIDEAERIVIVARIEHRADVYRAR